MKPLHYSHLLPQYFITSIKSYVSLMQLLGIGHTKL